MTLNPFKQILTSEYEINSLQYPLLFNFDQDTLLAAPGGLATELPSAENGGISADGLTYTIKIRDGLTWSDGEPITANDVAYTFNTILDLEFTDFSNYLPFTDSIEATDDTTLVWTTTKPTSAPLVPPWIFIVPEHVWSQYETKEEIRQARCNADAVGGRTIPGDGFPGRGVRHDGEHPGRELAGRAGARHGHLPVLRERGDDGPGPEAGRRSTSPKISPRICSRRS